MAIDTEEEEKKGGSGNCGGKSGAEGQKSDKTVIEQLKSASDIEERQRLMSSEDARPPPESTPLQGSSGGAAAAAAEAAARHRVQFAAASIVLDETDDAGCGGGGRGGGRGPFPYIDEEDERTAAADEEASTATNSPTVRHKPKRKRRRNMSADNTGSPSLSLSSAVSSTSSSSSSSSSSSEDTTEYSYVPPDGGWGWVIVAASFLVNMIADGVTFSFGVLFVELQSEFAESKAVTAGVVSLFHAVPLLSGPIASALTDRYGCRRMTILGSLLATAGFLLSAVTSNMWPLYLTFGLISGFGLSLCYVAAIVIVAYYFDRRRSFATGISVCGSGVGTFVFAPLTQYLVEEYGGWRGAAVILAGFFLNMCVCGALFRDLEWTTTRRKKRSEAKKSQLRKISGGSTGGGPRRGPRGSLSSFSATRGPSPTMPAVEDIRKLLESGEIATLFTREELEECDARLSSSLLNIPTYINNKERIPDEVMDVVVKNKMVYKFISENYPETLRPKEIADKEPNKPERGETLVPSVAVPEPAGVKLKRKVSSLFKKRNATDVAVIGGGGGDVGGANGGDLEPAPHRSILKKPQTRSLANPFDDGGGQQDFQRQHHLHPRALPNSAFGAMDLRHLRVRRQSLTYRGAMLNIGKYRLRASSCPDIYRNSMATIAEYDDYEDSYFGFWAAFSSGLKEFVVDCCRCGDFADSAFVVFCVSNFILYAWYDVMYVYLVDYAERDLNLELSDATFLISFIGILNTVGELIIGWVGDRAWANFNVIYAVCMVCCGLSTAVVPFLSSYGHLAAAASVYGFCISANYSLTSPMLVEIVSLDEFSHAYGLLLLVQGVSNLVGPPFAGYLFDVTRQWYLTFNLAGLFIAASGLVLLVPPCLKRIKRDRRRRQRRKASQLQADKKCEGHAQESPEAEAGETLRV